MCRPADGKSYYWDPLTESNPAAQRKVPQMATSKGSTRAPWIGPADQSFAEHIRLNPPSKKTKDEFALAQAGYLLVNGKWVDPDSEQELSEAYAYKNKAIERHANKGASKNNATRKEGSHEMTTETGGKESRGDARIHPYDPRLSYEPCEFGDNGLPPYTKYPIINGKLMTPEAEEEMYQMYNDFVSDDEGDPRDHHITPAQFSQMAFGSNFPSDYAVPAIKVSEVCIKFSFFAYANLFK